MDSITKINEAFQQRALRGHSGIKIPMKGVLILEIPIRVYVTWIKKLNGLDIVSYHTLYRGVYIYNGFNHNQPNARLINVTFRPNIDYADVFFDWLTF